MYLQYKIYKITISVLNSGLSSIFFGKKFVSKVMCCLNDVKQCQTPKDFNEIIYLFTLTNKWAICIPEY